MRIWIVENYEEMSRAASEIVAEQIRQKPNSTLGLSTGGTPVGMYRELSQMVKTGTLSFRNVNTFNLDEYIGLSKDHPQSYHEYMRETFFAHIDLPSEQAYLPYLESIGGDVEKICKAYDQLIDEKGGIDLQVLGIGPNGHIGFNEPADALEAGTHVATLTEETREVNARFFNGIEEVPTHAITMGVGSILKAKKILLIANGRNKAEAIAMMLKGKVTTKSPASLLQTHADVTIILDRDAAALL